MLDALSGFVAISIPIVIGYGLARFKVLTPETGQQLSRLAFSVLIPALLFHLMATADLSILFSKLALVSLLAAVIMFALYAVIAGGIWRRPLGAVTIGALAAGYMNANNIGLPLAAHMLGDPALAAPIVLFQTGLFAPICLAILDVAQGRRRSPAVPAADAAPAPSAEPTAGAGTDPKRTTAADKTEPDRATAAVGAASDTSATRRRPVWLVVLTALANPIVIGSLGGLICAGTGLTVPAWLMDPIDMVGRAAIPVMLIAFGMALRGRKLLAKGGGRRDVILASALKLVAMPLTAYLLARFAFGLTAAGIYAATVLAALPTAQNVFNYASRYQQGAILARDSITITTLGAAPLVLAIAALASLAP